MPKLVVLDRPQPAYASKILDVVADRALLSTHTDAGWQRPEPLQLDAVRTLAGRSSRATLRAAPNRRLLVRGGIRCRTLSARRHRRSALSVLVARHRNGARAERRAAPHISTVRAERAALRPRDRASEGASTMRRRRAGCARICLRANFARRSKRAANVCRSCSPHSIAGHFDRTLGYDPAGHAASVLRRALSGDERRGLCARRRDSQRSRGTCVLLDRRVLGPAPIRRGARALRPDLSRRGRCELFQHRAVELRRDRRCRASRPSWNPLRSADRDRVRRRCGYRRRSNARP